MNKETKFTKGDWKVQDSAPSEGHIRVTCGSNRGIVVVRNSTSKYFSADANRDIFSNAIANAHLIKTAPKLYAFIESLQLSIADDIKRDELLAEARGEQ